MPEGLGCIPEGMKRGRGPESPFDLPCPHTGIAPGGHPLSRLRFSSYPACLQLPGLRNAAGDGGGSVIPAATAPARPAGPPEYGLGIKSAMRKNGGRTRASALRVRAVPILPTRRQAPPLYSGGACRVYPYYQKGKRGSLGSVSWVWLLTRRVMASP